MEAPAITVRVCDSIACDIAGSRALLDKLPGLLGAGVRVLHAPCVGRCETAPVAVVGQNQVPHATAEKVNALVAANRVIVPVQAEYFALEGLAGLLDTLSLVQRELNPWLTVAGMLLTMHDGRTRLAQDVEREVREHFPELVFDTVIPRNVRIGEAPSFGKPIIFYDIHSKGAEGYTQLAQEVIANAEKRAGSGARSAHTGA